MTNVTEVSEIVRPHKKGPKPTPVKRFLESYTPEPNTGCWLWTRLVDKDGYGIHFANKQGRAHRFSFTIFKHEIPKGMIVMHSCDTPSCVNPDHLRLGTYYENSNDMVNKMRCRYKRPIKEILEIRADTSMSNRALAKKYNLSHTSVNKIKSKLAWKNVQ